MRAANLRIAYCASSTGGGDYTAQKKWDKELDLYKSAKSQGIQPDGTSTAKIRKAIEISDKTGVAYGS